MPSSKTEEIENLKRPITSAEIDSVIKKSSAPNGCTDEFYQMFKE